jgi:hypothetical protein
MDLPALSRALGLGEKEILPHLPHIAKSAAAEAPGLRWNPPVAPAVGLNSGSAGGSPRPDAAPGAKHPAFKDRGTGSSVKVDKAPFFIYLSQFK